MLRSGIGCVPVFADHRPEEVERGAWDAFEGTRLHPNQAEMPGESLGALPGIGQPAMKIAADVHPGRDRIVDGAEMTAQVVDPSRILEPATGTMLAGSGLPACRSARSASSTSA